jgi:MFS family permease
MSKHASDESKSQSCHADSCQRLHPDVLKLGLVSLLTDLSSEMIFSVFAVFFTTVAGASSSLLGLIEGLADFSASSLNYLVGWISDRSGRRKWLATAGYGFSTLAKLILLASSSVVSLSIFRVIERLGKGFRGPPRDAWLWPVCSHQPVVGAGEQPVGDGGNIRDLWSVLCD